MVPLPNIERVIDYFNWRQEDSNRNCLNSHSYWLLRRQGKSVKAATNELKGRGVAYKNELLFQNGINYNDLPAWQKRGVGVYWEEVEKEGLNPQTGQMEKAMRRALKVDRELPYGEEYEALLRKLLLEERRQP